MAPGPSSLCRRSAPGRAVELPTEGLSVARAEEVLRGETGEDFELADLVRDLAAPEFVARLWGHPVPGGEPPRA